VASVNRTRWLALIAWVLARLQGARMVFRYLD
jgi:hypothetical protein